MRAVVFREGEWWSAQCLEYDIAMQAKSYESLLDEIERVLECHFVIARKEGRAPFAGLSPAPKVFCDLAGALVRK